MNNLGGKMRQVIEEEFGEDREVAKYLGLKGIAGSDSHEKGSIGCFTTDFFEPVNTESDFLEQLHAGSFTISSLF
jgi:hypothetical protein